MIRLARLSAQQQFRLEKLRITQESKERKKVIDARVKAEQKKVVTKEKFAKQVESKNVKGVIPEVEERGMHSKPSFNPFSPPERVKVRDRNGLFITE